MLIVVLGANLLFAREGIVIGGRNTGPFALVNTSNYSVLSSTANIALTANYVAIAALSTTSNYSGTANIAITSNFSTSLNAIGLLGAITVSTENLVLVISSNGSVGIGTNSPAQALDVSGNIRIGGTGTALPAASAGYRGTLYMLQSAAGTADYIYLCMKKSDNSYQWVLISRGD